MVWEKCRLDPFPLAGNSEDLLLPLVIWVLPGKMDEWQLLADSEFHCAVASKTRAINGEELSDKHSLLELGPLDDERGKQVPPSIRLDLGGSHPQSHHKLTSYGRKGEPKAGHQYPLGYGHITADDGKFPGLLKVKPHRGRNIVTLAKAGFVGSRDQGPELIFMRNKVCGTTTDATAIRIWARCHLKEVGKMFEGS
jgi:hypothetical protein